MTQVYVLEDVSGRRNAYGIDRTETWKQRLDKCFENYDDAVQYVKEKTRNLPQFKVLVQGKPKDKYEEFLDLFIKSDYYIHHNRYFIGEVPFHRIRLALENDGINVIDSRK